MKNLLFFIFLLLSSQAISQRWTPMTSKGYEFKGVLADTLLIPTGCGAPTSTPGLIYAHAALYFDSCGKNTYRYDPSILLWAPIGGGGGDMVTLQDVPTLLAFVRDTIDAAIVREAKRGGLFVWDSVGTANNITVYNAVGGGFWVRQFDNYIHSNWAGCKGDGITNDRDSLQAAIDFCRSVNLPLWIDNTGLPYLVSPDVNNRTLIINGSITILSDGATIQPTTTNILLPVFSLSATIPDSTEILIDGLNSVGVARSRFLCDTVGTAGLRSLIKSVKLNNLRLGAHSIIVDFNCSDFCEITNITMGIGIDSNDVSAPTISVTNDATYNGSKRLLIDNCYIYAGNEDKDLYFIKGDSFEDVILTNSVGHSLKDIPGRTGDAFDLDNTGRRATFSNLRGIRCGIEIKPGTSLLQNYALNVSDITTINASNAGISCRAAGNYTNLMAYNSVGTGLFVSTFSASTIGTVDDVFINITNAQVINAGAANTSARTAIGLSNINISGLQIFNEAGITTSVASALRFNESHNISIQNLLIRHASIAISVSDAINKVALNDVTLLDISTRLFSFSDSITNLKVENVRVERFTGGINGEVAFGLPPVINSQFNGFPAELLAATIAPSAFIAKCHEISFDGFYYDRTAIADSIPEVFTHYPIGAIVINVADGTMWGRKSMSAVPLEAYRFLGTKINNRTCMTYDIATGFFTNGCIEGETQTKISRIDNPQGGLFKSDIGTDTGAIKILLPPVSLYTMISINGTVFDYGEEVSGAPGSSNHPDLSFTFQISGYCYDDGWRNTTAVITGSDSTRNFTVRFNKNGSDFIIYIGELDNILGYTAITIDEIQGSFSGATLATLSRNWSISLEKIAFAGTTQRTVTNTFPWGDYNKLINVPPGGGGGGDETDPIAIAKTITLIEGANVTITGASTQTLNSNPTWTINSTGGGGGGGITALTGDVTASGTGSVAATLSNTGVTAGTYTSADITVDAKGRISSASNGSGSGSGAYINNGTTIQTANFWISGQGRIGGDLIVDNFATFNNDAIFDKAGAFPGRATFKSATNNQVFLQYNGTSNHTAILPENDGILVASVNGVEPDAAGNVNVSGGGGGGDPVAFITLTQATPTVWDRDLSTSSQFTITANRTISVIDDADGEEGWLYITQGGAGGFDLRVGDNDLLQDGISITPPIGGQKWIDLNDESGSINTIFYKRRGSVRIWYMDWVH